jgi:hypothetical protein
VRVKVSSPDRKLIGLPPKPGPLLTQYSFVEKSVSALFAAYEWEASSMKNKKVAVFFDQGCMKALLKLR